MTALVDSPVETMETSRLGGTLEGVDTPVHIRTRPLLEASPYPDLEHLLDLDTVDDPNRLLAQALTILEPTDERYATTKYEDAMNWPAMMDQLRDLCTNEGFRWLEKNFYVVEFRSRLKIDIDNDTLFELDKESHREATESGGLLKYWFGSPDADRRNLATCVWRSKEDAIVGGRGPWHKKARAVIHRMYEEIKIRGLVLTIGDDAQSWTFQPYV